MSALSKGMPQQPKQQQGGDAQGAPAADKKRPLGAPGGAAPAKNGALGTAASTKRPKGSSAQAQPGGATAAATANAKVTRLPTSAAVGPLAALGLVRTDSNGAAKDAGAKPTSIASAAFKPSTKAKGAWASAPALCDQCTRCNQLSQAAQWRQLLTCAHLFTASNHCAVWHLPSLPDAQGMNTRPSPPPSAGGFRALAASSASAAKTLRPASEAEKPRLSLEAAASQLVGSRLPAGRQVAR